MENMNITSAQYRLINEELDMYNIDVVIDGITMSVPLDPANRHYAEIMRQVEAGELTIQDQTRNQPRGYELLERRRLARRRQNPVSVRLCRKAWRMGKGQPKPV